MARVADIDYIVTDTEKEALILENTLIKEHRPRYKSTCVTTRHIFHSHDMSEDFPPDVNSQSDKGRSPLFRALFIRLRRKGCAEADLQTFPSAPLPLKPAGGVVAHASSTR
jgi:hypothetical protein